MVTLAESDAELLPDFVSLAHQNVKPNLMRLAKEISLTSILKCRT